MSGGERKVRQLRKWNGRGHGKYDRHHIYVAAHSMAEAARLVSSACYDAPDFIKSREIRDYYSECWGNPMKGVEPSEPSVFVNKFSETPVRVL